jgi:membrane-associated phospholipid phosphatase
VLRDHRRALLYSAVLLSATTAAFVVVGVAPRRPIVQPIDDWWYGAIDSVRSTAATVVARALDILGGAYVTLPIRVGVSAWLLLRRRWRALATWVLTWLLSEVTVTVVKDAFDRPRPPDQLVPTSSSAFPSGHATAAAATATALVLVLMPQGPTRRKWEVAAASLTFLMSLSRTYLNAHWLSDVVAGSLLGAGIAILCAGLTTEVRDVAMRRRVRARPGSNGEPRGEAGERGAVSPRAPG